MEYAPPESSGHLPAAPLLAQLLPALVRCHVARPQAQPAPGGQLQLLPQLPQQLLVHWPVPPQPTLQCTGLTPLCHHRLTPVL